MFSTKASLSVHNERRHGIKVAKKKCFVCAEILNAQDVKQHILSAHPGALPEDDAGREEQKVEEDVQGQIDGIVIVRIPKLPARFSSDFST